MASPGGGALELGVRVDIPARGRINCATLLFLGETDFAPGQWAGLALDGATGKNDGSVGGRRYFACKPKHGLFLRPHQVRITRARHLSPALRRGSAGGPVASAKRASKHVTAAPGTNPAESRPASDKGGSRKAGGSKSGSTGNAAGRRRGAAAQETEDAASASSGASDADDANAHAAGSLGGSAAPSPHRRPAVEVAAAAPDTAAPAQPAAAAATGKASRGRSRGKHAGRGAGGPSRQLSPVVASKLASVSSKLSEMDSRLERLGVEDAAATPPATADPPTPVIGQPPTPPRTRSDESSQSGGGPPASAAKERTESSVFSPESESRVKHTSDRLRSINEAFSALDDQNARLAREVAELIGDAPSISTGGSTAATSQVASAPGTRPGDGDVDDGVLDKLTNVTAALGLDRLEAARKADAPQAPKGSGHRASISSLSPSEVASVATSTGSSSAQGSIERRRSSGGLRRRSSAAALRRKASHASLVRDKANHNASSMLQTSLVDLAAVFGEVEGGSDDSEEDGTAEASASSGAEAEEEVARREKLAAERMEKQEALQRSRAAAESAARAAELDEDALLASLEDHTSQGAKRRHRSRSPSQRAGSGDSSASAESHDGEARRRDAGMRSLARLEFLLSPEGPASSASAAAVPGSPTRSGARPFTPKRSAPILSPRGGNKATGSGIPATVIHELNAELLHVRRVVERLTRERDQLEQRVEAASTTRSALLTERDHLAEHAHTLESELSVAKAKVGTVRALQSRVSDMETHMDMLRNEAERWKRDAERESSERARISAKMDALRSDQETTTTALEVARRELSAAVNEVRHLRDLNDTLRRQMADTDKEREGMLRVVEQAREGTKSSEAARERLQFVINSANSRAERAEELRAAAEAERDRALDRAAEAAADAEASRTKAAELESQMAESSVARAKVSESASAATAELSRLRAARREGESKLVATQAELREAQQLLSAATKRSESLQHRVDRAEAEADRLRRSEAKAIDEADRLSRLLEEAKLGQRASSDQRDDARSLLEAELQRVRDELEAAVVRVREAEDEVASLNAEADDARDRQREAEERADDADKLVALFVVEAAKLGAALQDVAGDIEADADADDAQSALAVLSAAVEAATDAKAAVDAAEAALEASQQNAARLEKELVTAREQASTYRQAYEEAAGRVAKSPAAVPAGSRLDHVPASEASTGPTLDVATVQAAAAHWREEARKLRDELSAVRSQSPDFSAVLPAQDSSPGISPAGLRAELGETSGISAGISPASGSSSVTRVESAKRGDATLMEASGWSVASPEPSIAHRHVKPAPSFSPVKETEEHLVVSGEAAQGSDGDGETDSVDGSTALAHAVATAVTAPPKLVSGATAAAANGKGAAPEREAPIGEAPTQLGDSAEDDGATADLVPLPPKAQPTSTGSPDERALVAAAPGVGREQQGRRPKRDPERAPVALDISSGIEVDAGRAAALQRKRDKFADARAARHEQQRKQADARAKHAERSKSAGRARPGASGTPSKSRPGAAAEGASAPDTRSGGAARHASPARVRGEGPQMSTRPPTRQHSATTKETRTANHRRVKHALSNVCLAGRHMDTKRLQALDALSTPAAEAAHWVVTFADAKSLVSFMGLYIMDDGLANGTRVFGTGPPTLSAAKVVGYLKYDTAARGFKSLGVHDFTSTTDAVALTSAAVAASKRKRRTAGGAGGAKTGSPPRRQTPGRERPGQQ